VVLIADLRTSRLRGKLRRGYGVVEMQSVRFRIDFNQHCSIGPGKIDLLEAISRSGSISRAAQELGMSYRHAWLLVDSLNNSFTEPVTTSSVGGAGGGGVKLTPFGADLIRSYRVAGRRIETLVRTEFEDFLRKARSGATASLGRRRLVRRTGRSRTKPAS